MPQLSLGQKEMLVKLIHEDSHFLKHFFVEDRGEVYDKIKNVTYKQYQEWFKPNLFHKKYTKLNGFLAGLGFRRK